MKLLVKLICCLMTAVLFFYLVIVDYPKLVVRLDPRVAGQTGFEGLNMGESDSDTENQIIEDVQNTADSSPEEQVKLLEKQIEELEKQQSTSGCAVSLYFDQVFESGYEQLFPMMKEKGLTGTLVLTDGQLPGDNLQMTEEQCLEMLDAGWELAVGGSEDIDMTGNLQTVAAAWGTYLKGYLKEIKTRLNLVPTTYCFNEGEYRKEFDAVLKELGFKTIRYYGDADLEGTADGLTRIRGYRVSQNSDVKTVVKDLGEYSSAALSTRRVAEGIEGDSQNIEINKYESLLDSIQKSDNLYIAGSDKEKEFKAQKDSLSKQIEEMKKQKEKIEKQIEEE